MSLEKVKAAFKEAVKVINDELGEDYAQKNPQLIMHLLATKQQEEDREVLKKMNDIP